MVGWDLNGEGQGCQVTYFIEQWQSLRFCVLNAMNRCSFKYKINESCVKLIPNLIAQQDTVNLATLNLSGNKNVALGSSIHAMLLYLSPHPLFHGGFNQVEK